MQKYIRYLVLAACTLSVSLFGSQENIRFIGGVPLRFYKRDLLHIQAAELKVENRRQMFQLPAIETPRKQPSFLDKVYTYAWRKYRSALCWWNWGSDLNKGSLFFRAHAGCSPLTSGIRWGNAKQVKLLLENGASMYHEDDLEDIPLADAITSNNKAIIRLFVAAGADLNYRRGEEDRESLFNRLMWGSERNGLKPETVRFLVKHGVDINQLNMLSSTPLYRCSERQKLPRLAKFFIKNGAEITVTDRMPLEYWAHAFAWRNQLTKQYYQHKQPQQKQQITQAIVASHNPPQMPTALAGLIADYAVLNWREYVQQNKMRNIARGRALAEAGVENCDISLAAAQQSYDSDDEKSDDEDDGEL